MKSPTVCTAANSQNRALSLLLPSSPTIQVELARDDGDTSDIIGTGGSLSRASSLVQGIQGERLICERSKNSVGDSMVQGYPLNALR
ncbi:hypothetical protein D3C76_955230 [compost metagenome]